MEQVILLNADYTFLTLISWKRAVRLLIKEKVEVLKETNRVICSSDNTINIVIPKILKLVKLVRAYFKKKVFFSKRNVMIRDDYTCMYCGVKESKMTIDHVVPISRGGKSTFENCVTSCKKCNNRKNNRLPSEVKMYLKRQATTPTIMEFVMLKMKTLGINQLLKELC